MIDSTDSDYRAFLIRGWREGDNWRFTLEMIGKTRQQRHGFSGYAQLANFLQKQFYGEDDNLDGRQTDDAEKQ